MAFASYMVVPKGKPFITEDSAELGKKVAVAGFLQYIVSSDDERRICVVFYHSDANAAREFMVQNKDALKKHRSARERFYGVPQYDPDANAPMEGSEYRYDEDYGAGTVSSVISVAKMKANG